MTPDEFGAKIKAKYPQYAGIDNAELSRRIVAKHPEYSSQVTFTDATNDAPAAPASFGTAPENDNFDVVGRSRPATGVPTFAPEIIQPQQGVNLHRALLTNEPTQSDSEAIVRGIPAAVGGYVGGTAGLAGGVALAIPSLGASIPAGAAASVGLAGLGGAGMEGLRQIAVNLDSKYHGREVTPASQALGQIGAQGATQSAGQAAGLAIPPVAKAIGRGMVNNPLARAVGGYTKEAADRLMSNADDVIKNLGTEDSIGGKVYGAANKFKDAIDENIGIAGEKYRELVNKVIGENPKYGPGFKLNLQEAIGNDVAQIAKEYGYGMPGRIGQEAASQEKFLTFMRKANDLKSASPDELYWFQRDLGHAQRSATDPVLSGALGKVKKALNSYLDVKIPEIGEGNKIYAEALNLADELSKIDGADNASKAILSKFRQYGSDTRQAILEATKQLPKAQEALDSLLTLESAKQFSKGMPNIMNTGGGASALAATKIAFNPLAIPTTVLMAPGFSPLATSYAVKGVQAASKLVPSWAGRAAAPPISSLAGTRVGELLAPPQLSPNMQAVLEAANKSGLSNRRIPIADPSMQAIGGVMDARR